MTPAEAINSQIHELERHVLIVTGVLGGLVLIVGIVGWRDLWWGGLVGLLLGLGSFHLLAVTVSNIGVGSGLAGGAAMLLSTLKMLVLFLIVLGIHFFKLVDIVQVLVGLLLSQVGIAAAIMKSMVRKNSGGPHGRT
ncbi:MAG: hypothetical protein HQM09_05640 [Candidatus Riflebacteria bacterium]|nr:hypothetical protein [Candidatus Riflebacteria bacterium]